MSFIVLVSCIFFRINSHANAAEVCRESPRRATGMGRVVARRGKDRITDEIAKRVSVDRAYQNAKQIRPPKRPHRARQGAQTSDHAMSARAMVRDGRPAAEWQRASRPYFCRISIAALCRNRFGLHVGKEAMPCVVRSVLAFARARATARLYESFMLT
jgi:hypothetical protein